ncbi:MAG: type II secretion system major pseudopilin GspG [Candidatus Omnitrophica bacterium]|nr:type II secretion system major pseudopilin GspG [Candidatus Omnitrophota bacterium]MCF7876769.1 type II secretion system major pseudopilin GspG [Candidatus Omnitrophota bacterium]MCF7878215.1 type II secretion system major pseudopilin GspG [Candidatus Omnitrophota bacterium]
MIKTQNAKRTTHNALRTTKHAFTLIELMLVVVILGALAAMIVPRMAGRSQQAKISIAKADIMSNIPSALDLYELDNGAYPSTEQGLDALLSKPAGSPQPNNWNGPYLKKKPIDPWGSEYQYRYPSQHQRLDYDLYSFGPDQVKSDDDVTNWE